MPSRGVVPTFDELEAGQAGLSLCLERPAIQRVAFEDRKEAFAHGVIIAIANPAQTMQDQIDTLVDCHMEALGVFADDDSAEAAMYDELAEPLD